MMSQCANKDHLIPNCKNKIKLFSYEYTHWVQKFKTYRRQTSFAILINQHLVSLRRKKEGKRKKRRKREKEVAHIEPLWHTNIWT